MDKKIEKWLKEGLIDETTASKMLAEIKEDKARSRRIKINIVVYTLAVILIGLGVITFIAANDWLLNLLNSSDFLKIFLMTGVTILSLWGGYKLGYEKKNFPRLGNALIILSALLIGCTYMLIGQIYNIAANSSSLMFLWFFSILPIAYFFKSYAVNIISIVLAVFGIVFFYGELGLDRLLVWTVYIPVLCATLFYSLGNIPVVLDKYTNFSLSYKLVGVIPIFATLLILTLSVEKSYHITSVFYILPIVLLIFLNLVNYLFNKKRDTLFKIETVSLITILSMLLLLLCLPSVNIFIVNILANIIIISMMFFGFNYGYKFENAHIITVTNWITTIYLATNYFRFCWSLLDKSLFFMLGGLSLLTFGLFLEKKRNEILKK